MGGCRNSDEAENAAANADFEEEPFYPDKINP
jgi:hypothetical protein